MHTTKEIAKAMGVAASTIKRWQNVYKIPRELGANRHARYSQESYDLFKTIHSLSQAGKKASEIKTIIGHPGKQSPVQATEAPAPDIDAEKLSQVIVGVIKEQDVLAEKYARASYLIGQLEAEKKYIQESLDIKEQTILMIEESSQARAAALDKVSQDHAAAKAEQRSLQKAIAELKEALARLRADSSQKIAALEKELKEAKAKADRPWYKRLNKK